jgi:hypothetical protein
VTDKLVDVAPNAPKFVGTLVVNGVLACADRDGNVRADQAAGQRCGRRRPLR